MKQWLKSQPAYDKAEKYLQTDLTYLLSGSFWIGFGQAISALVSFGMAYIFANYLPQETYGVYKYVFATMGILSIATLTGMKFATTQAVAKGYDGVFYPILKAKIQWGFLGSLASFGIALYYFFNGNAELAQIFVIVGIVVPFIDSFALYTSLLAGKKQFKVSSLNNMFVQVGVAVSTGASVLLTDNIITILLVNLSVTTVLRLFSLRRLAKKFLTNTKSDADSIKFGKGLSATGVIGTISEHLDSILLWHFMGPSAVAVYGFALATTVPVKTFFKSIVSLAHPKFALESTGNLKANLVKKIWKGVFIIAPFVFLYILIIPYVFEFFFPQYTESAIYAQFIALSFFFFPDKLLSTAVNTRGNHKVTYFMNTIHPLMRIGILIVLLPFFGIWGAVSALLIQHVLTLAVVWYFFKRME